MRARSIPFGSMFAWIPATFRLVGNNAGAMVAASLIMLLAGVVLMAPVFYFMFKSMLTGLGAPGVPQPQDMTAFWIAYAICIVAGLLLFPPMLAGWFRLCAGADSGHGVAATQILSVYGDGATWVRLIAFAFVAMLSYALVFGLMYLVFHGAFDELLAMQAAQQAALATGAPPPPPSMALLGQIFALYAVMLPTMFVLQFIYMVIAHPVTPYLFTGLLGLAYLRRIAGNFGRQPWRPVRTGIRLGLLSLALVALLFAAAFVPGAGLSVGIGLAAGATLAFFALRHNHADIVDGKRGYTPNPWIGGALSLLLVGRLAWRMQAEQTRYAIEVPKLGSLILTHSMTGQFPGLKEFPREDRPNATVLFFTFRAMVGLGLLMIALAFCALLARWRGKLYQSRFVQRYALWMGPAGLAAILFGWMTTEIGRQPWIVYGLMRTSEAVSPHGAAPVALTLAIFVVVYFTVFGAGTWYGLKIIAKGPATGEAQAPVDGGPGQPRTPSRPLSAAPEKEA